MLTSLLILTLMAPPVPPVAADQVCLHGKIWTVDPANPEVQAMAIWNGRILKLGTTEEIQSLVGPKTEVIDLKGQRVVPGFYDSHVHLLGGGRSLSQVDLKDCADEAEFGRRLKAFDDKMPRDRWMLGGNWDHDRTFQGQLPTAAILDKYVKNRPVFINRYDGHMSVANTLAMKQAGVTAETRDPPGGVIYRLADGKTPSGVFKDNAMALIDKLIPEPGADEIAEAISSAMGAFAASGITSVQDMDGSEAGTRRILFGTLQSLAEKGNSLARVDLRWPIARYQELANLGTMANFGNDLVRIGGVKGFMDGSLGSSTAVMFDPYVGEAKNFGVHVTEPSQMGMLIRAADKAGISVAIHAIGDKANAELLDLFAEATKANGARDRRFRIEHVQHLRPSDYPRFKAGNVVASMQPYHVIDDGRWAEGRIGKSRCQSSYAYRSLLDHGAVLAFGSDWPVAPLDVMAGIDAAVNRRPLDGKHPGGWFPEQKITVAEAVEAYTRGSAYGAHQEHERGSLAAGKLADFVVLSRDILAPGEKDQIVNTKVVSTYLAGKRVFPLSK